MPGASESERSKASSNYFFNKAKIRKYFIPSYPLASKGKDKAEDALSIGLAPIEA